MNKIKKTIWGICIILFANNYLSPAQTFCIPVFGDTIAHIDNFAFHTLVNIYSGASSSGYISYPDSLFTTSLNIGETYPITISNKYPSGNYGKFAAWIDYNNDSLFDNSELVHYDSISEYTTSGFVTIPNNNGFLGQRRLRVVSAFYPPTVTPCGNYISGEAEDYTVNIVSNQPDTQTYCMPFNPVNVDNFIIEDFHVGTLINNNSGSNGTNYILYDSILFSANLNLNTSYPVYVSKGSSLGSSGGFAIWIDLDDNGDFSLSENLFSAGPNLTFASGTIAIPNDSSFIGSRRLRVRAQFGLLPTDPCGLYAAGETEDYLVTITGNPTSILNYPPNSNSILIFPNPSHGDVNILSAKNIDEIKITNSLGQINYELKPNRENVFLQIANEGIYFVTITSGNKTATAKLIVTR